jgi:hypothetical protein
MYEWGVSITWAPDWGDGTEVKECTSEGDARARVSHWRERQKRARSERVTDMHLVRRPVGAWEPVQ